MKNTGGVSKFYVHFFNFSVVEVPIFLLEDSLRVTK